MKVENMDLLKEITGHPTDHEGLWRPLAKLLEERVPGCRFQIVSSHDKVFVSGLEFHLPDDLRLMLFDEAKREDRLIKSDLDDNLSVYAIPVDTFDEVLIFILPDQNVDLPSKSYGAAMVRLCVDFFIAQRSFDDELNTLTVQKNQTRRGFRALEEKCQEISDDNQRAFQKLRVANDELEKAHRELKESTTQLMQAEKLNALGELTASVTHELNQPLTGITIISQSLLEDIENNKLEEEELRDEMKAIVDEASKMAEIIDHMGIYSRNTEDVHEEMIDINTVLEGPFKLLNQQLKIHKIEILKELTPDLPVVVGDQIRLGQVFMNLITNARHAVDSCGRENKRIEIRSYKTDSHGLAPDNPALVVEVKDNGEGIPEDIREKIFDSFFTTKESGKGTGLGLSVSSKIIEEHKGRIEMESQVGEGTTFRVILPIAD